MKTHIIHWKSTVTGRTGQGTLLFEKQDAERLAAELNQSYPGILHEAVLVVTAPFAAPSRVSQPVAMG